MFKQLTRVGIQTNLGFLSVNVAPRNLYIEFIHEVRNATRLPIERTQKVFKKFIEDFKRARLNAVV